MRNIGIVVVAIRNQGELELKLESNPWETYLLYFIFLSMGFILLANLFDGVEVNKKKEQITRKEQTMTMKQVAIDRLFSEYTDIYGRITLHPAKNHTHIYPNYDSENQGLWTGEAGILLKLNNAHANDISKYRANFDRMMNHIAVGPPGLYSRHPAPFWHNDHHNVSKDEYRGFAYGAVATGNPKLMGPIISYGEVNSWFYVDDDPYGGINTDHMGGYRTPTDRGLYNIAAKREPSLLQVLFMGGSAWLNSRKPKGDTSSKVMSWFNFKSVEITGYKSKILSFFKKRFDKNMKMMYNGDNYMEEVFKIYFQPDHPFHVLVKGLK